MVVVMKFCDLQTGIYRVVSYLFSNLPVLFTAYVPYNNKTVAMELIPSRPDVKHSIQLAGALP